MAEEDDGLWRTRGGGGEGGGGGGVGREEAGAIEDARGKFGKDNGSAY